MNCKVVIIQLGIDSTNFLKYHILEYALDTQIFDNQIHAVEYNIDGYKPQGRDQRVPQGLL